MNRILFLIFSFFCLHAYGQQSPVLKIVSPVKEKITVTTSKQFITGVTCADCEIIINNTKVKVYRTGAFAHTVFLSSGENNFQVKAVLGGKETIKKVAFTFDDPKLKPATDPVPIGAVKVWPEGNLILRPGDKIDFEVKGFPGGKMKVWDTELKETNIPGNYAGSYLIQSGDTFRNRKAVVLLESKDGKAYTSQIPYNYSVMNENDPGVVATKGRLAHLEYGLGDDRLGGAKIGYLDSLIPLRVIGKVGKDYKIALAPGRTAYIEDDLVTTLSSYTFASRQLTGKWNVYGDGKFDYIEIGLQQRLPYQSMQQVNPSKIVIDIFGAVNNTNWITQLQSVKEVSNIEYEQVSDEVFRIIVHLKHQQHWGHQIYYSGNRLVIKIRNQPKNPELNSLIIGVDAGHGGSNIGGVGISGALEKNVTLALSLKLKDLLEKEGAKVILTRDTETFFDNKERILFYRDSTPDLLISLHTNSSSDPVNVEGTGTFYRYPGFRSLNLFIQKRMLELGLKDYGVNGSFNFMLNSPTEYPNSLVETVFLSNPSEEEKILDPNFQRQVAEKIVAGIKDFLQYSKTN